MSTDLKEKPSGIYDDEEKRAAEQERLKNLEEDFKKPAIEDKDRNTKSDSTDAIKSSEEKKAEPPLSDKAEAPGKTSASSLYNNKGRSKFSIKGAMSSTRTKIGLAVATAIISAFAAITTMAPNFIINHLKEILLGRVSNVQMFHQRRYRQKKLTKFKNYFSKNGRMAQKIIDEMELDGYNVIHDGGKIKGISPGNARNSTIIGDAIGDHIDEYMNVKHPFRTARWKTKRMNALYKEFGISRSSIVTQDKIRAGPDGEPDYNKTVNGELAEEVLDGEDPSITRAPNDDPDEEAKSQQDKIDESYDNTSSELGDELEAGKAELLDGKNLDEIDDAVRIAAESGDGITPELANLAEEAVNNTGKLAKTGQFFKSFLSPTEALDHICTLRNSLNAAVKLARAAKAIKLMRYAFAFISAADDARTGKATAGSMNALFKRVTAEDINGNAIGASPGFGYMMKSKFSKSRNDAMKSPVAVDGKLTGTLGGVHNKVSTLPGLSTCPVVQNPVAQAGVAVGSIALAVFSGGSSAAIQEGFEISLTTGLKKVLTEVTESVVTKQALRQLAVGAVQELSFTAIMMIAELQVQKALNVPFTGQEKGGQLGDILVAGAGTSNKQRSLAAGMVPATTQQYAQANTEYLAWKKEQDGRKSIFQRTFATDDTNSLLFNLALAAPAADGTLLRNGFNSSLALVSSSLNPKTMISTIMTALTPRASALDGDEIAFDELTISGDGADQPFATDPAGNLQVIMRKDIEDIDPEDNIDLLIASGDIDATTLEPKSTAFTDHIGYCIDNPDIISSMEEGKGDCLALQPKTKRFKAHLAYLDLDDSLHAEFFPEEINQKDAATPDSSNSGGGAVPYTNPITEDLTSPIPGTSVRIATNILPQVNSMIAAAQADGINLLPISSGWRDPAKQIALRKQNCPDWQNSRSSDCSPPTAKPGTSNHERGQAIDFSNMCYPNGKTCPGNPRWEWLTNNASKFGFKPLASEAWHWSLTGN